ncbi:hypothetical protein, partial [Streptomyces beihaiensis]
AGFAVPLRAAAAEDREGALAELLARNAASAPAYGRELNLAGVLHLTAVSVGSDGPAHDGADPVERPEVADELAAFTGGPPHGTAAPDAASPDAGARVVALVGEPGSGRTTELARSEE